MSTDAGPVTVVITCPIQPGKIDVARRDFTEIISTVVKNEAACHGIRLHVESNNPHRLLLVEYWDSQEDYTGPHMATPHMQAFLKRAEGFLAGPPEFSFWREIAAAR